jgi:hypothetical protein
MSLAVVVGLATKSDDRVFRWLILGAMLFLSLLAGWTFPAMKQVVERYESRSNRKD